jgi:hypothetical protein
LQENSVNLITIAFGELDDQEKQNFNAFTQTTNNGNFLLNPTHGKLKELFLEISNFKFAATPLILETFN